MKKKTTKTMPLSVDEIDTMYRSMLKVEDGDSILKSIGKVPSFDTERALSKNFKNANFKTPNFKPANNFKTGGNNLKPSNNANFKTPNANANFKTPNANANFKPANANANFKPANANANFKTPNANANFKPSNNANFKPSNFNTRTNFSLDKKPWWKFW